MAKAKSKCKRVSRDAAKWKSGNKKGKLRPGCKYLKGDGVHCCPSPKAGAVVKGQPAKKATKKRSGRRKARSVKRKSSRKGTRPATPNMNYLNLIRRRWKAGDCRDKRKTLREIRKLFEVMSQKPAKQKKGESQSQAAKRRWNRWQNEFQNKLIATEEHCKGSKGPYTRGPFRVQRTRGPYFPAKPKVYTRGPYPVSRAPRGAESNPGRTTPDVLRGVGKSGGHPCASANPPSWCR